MSQRWWEAYFVRYAVGSPIGVVILFFLLEKINHNWLLKFWGLFDKGAAGFLAVFFCGVAYCYIASAPIFVLHISRGLLHNTKKNDDLNLYHTDFSETYFLILLNLMICIPMVFFTLFFFGGTFISDVFLCIGVIVCFLSIIISISCLVFSRKIYDYVSKLASKRAMANIKSNNEFVETYRHLREHGNAYFIVIFEILLGLCLYSMVPENVSSFKVEFFYSVILFIFFWCFSSALVWFFAVKLEKFFVEFE